MLYAYADFELKKLGITVRAGETFEPPADWIRDIEQEELMGTLKARSRIGMVFSYRGQQVNDGDKKNPPEYRYHTAVLPLEERA